MAYEPHHKPPISRAAFLRRLALHLAWGAGIVLVSLGIGMAGYMHFEDLSWRDAFLNSAMLLGGMGPVNAIRTEAGKLFAGTYALYCGLVFLAVAGLVLAPVIHRVLHLFHWEVQGTRPQ